jgi:PIN domain nuclease of toxin-antitoxin system
LILLDTVTLVWAAMDDPRLGHQSRSMIEEAGPSNLCVSAISPWEVAMLVRKDRLDLGEEPLVWFQAIMARTGMDLIAVEPDIAVDAGLLPRTVHGDPADRLIMATARKLACPLLTPDSKILEQAQTGLLEAVDARR